MGEEIVYLDDTRLERYALFDRIQLAGAALALVLTSLERLRLPATKDLVLGTLQLATSLAVIAFVVAWARSRHAPSTARVGWLDIVAGLMLLVEWADRCLQSGQVITPVLFQAAIFIVLGLLHARLAKRRKSRRHVRVDDEGIRIRRSAIRRRSIAWSEVASVSREPQAIRITRLDGTAWRIRLGRYKNGEEVARLVLNAAAARGLATDEAL